jgi:hypothetical protein
MDMYSLYSKEEGHVFLGILLARNSRLLEYSLLQNGFYCYVRTTRCGHNFRGVVQ